MPAELRCFDAQCGARYAITEVLYNCPKCGALIEASYDFDADPAALKRLFRERRMSNAPLDASGVWRYRELFPFLDDFSPVVTLAGREHAVARCTHRGAVRRARSNRVQASGIQSDRFVQRQRNDLRSGAGAPAGHAARGVRVHRQHVGIDGRLRCGGRPRRADFPAARKYFFREAFAGARIWREHVRSGGELRSDSGAGARAGGTRWESIC